MKPAFLAAVRILIVGAMVLAGWSLSESVVAAKKRKRAPDFALPDAQGKTVRLSDFKGKVVVLDFWATWCGPCKIEIPWFIEFQNKYKDKEFSVIGVSMDEKGWSVVRPFVEEMKMDYPVLLGNEAMASVFGGLDELPATYIIDREGYIVSRHTGLAKKDAIEKAIKALL